MIKNEKLPSKIFLAVVLTLMLSLANAQGPADPGGDPDPVAPTTSVPFDGGLTVLIAAGAGFAIKQARDKKRNKKVTSD